LAGNQQISRTGLCVERLDSVAMEQPDIQVQIMLLTHFNDQPLTERDPCLMLSVLHLKRQRSRLWAQAKARVHRLYHQNGRQARIALLGQQASEFKGMSGNRLIAHVYQYISQVSHDGSQVVARGPQAYIRLP
jgi:hypothetical protein